MTTATSQRIGAEEDAPDELLRFSVRRYRRMVEKGLIAPDARVELLDGLLVKKMNKGVRHVVVTHRIFVALLTRLPEGFFPRKEDPVELPGGPRGDSVPEPDVAVMAGTIDDSVLRHPGPGQMRLAIQVAGRSLYRDRRGLERLAWAEIPMVWIVNLRDNTIEIDGGPSGPVPGAGYAEKSVKQPGDSLEFMLDGAKVGPFAVSDFLA